MAEADYDVVVAGAGNAALCAAIAARQAGARVLVLERAPAAELGGNSAFTAGAMRVPLKSIEQLLALAPQLADTAASVAFTSYDEAEFVEDIVRLSGNANDRKLVELIAANAFSTISWMAGFGVRFESQLERRGVKVGGRTYNPREAALRVIGQGKGLIDTLWQAAETLGVDFSYDTEAAGLIVEDDAVVGLTIRRGGRTQALRAGRIILACGGFEASPEMRARYLGPDWDLAKVRGSRFNTGLGLKMALAAGAAAYGNWSGAHAIAQDINAPAFGNDPATAELEGKDCYYLSIIVNRDGERFVDEGADFRVFTYSTQGHVIVRQPGSVAFEIFDAKTYGKLDHSYRIPQATSVKAETLRELAEQLGIKPEPFLETVRAFNAGVREDVPLDDAIRDGRGTVGVSPPKSNWAQKLDAPPYWGFPVTAGITFTYGGVRVDEHARVLTETLEPIPNLYAAGEMVGGIFFRNYPGSSGLVSGAVMGRIAGTAAARNHDR
jgi:tricarballylate dehydrogenase